MASLDESLFQADFEAVTGTEEARRWTLERSHPFGVFAEMSPIAFPDEVYRAHLRWKSYPGSLPSLKFRSLVTESETDPTAWPLLPGFRPTSFDSCVHWTAEGHAIHPEWVNSAHTKHDPSANGIFQALCFLQDGLDFHYQGRFKP